MPLEDVDKFKYLGSKFIASGQRNEEIRNRISLGRGRQRRVRFFLTDAKTF